MIEPKMRLQVYVLMLEIFAQSVKNGIPRGLCGLIRESRHRISKSHPDFRDSNFFIRIENYKELINQKPTYTKGLWWWPIYEVNARIAVIEQAIEEVKQLIP